MLSDALQVDGDPGSAGVLMETPVLASAKRTWEGKDLKAMGAFFVFFPFFRVTSSLEFPDQSRVQGGR